MTNASGTRGPIRVLVVDDHELFRQGVCTILSRAGDLEVVDQAEDGRQAVEKCRQHLPDVVLMDINMPVCDGLEATRQIKREHPYVKILILTVSDAEESLFEAVKSGASGYVLKNASPTEVIDSVRRVSAGEPVIPGNLAMQIITEFSKPVVRPVQQQVEQLTEREIEVLRYLSAGATNKDIANALFISENTVRNHVRNILEKLHLSNRVQAAAYAVREGYVMKKEEN
ncbi:response regulator [Alicyclobacillus macrosporangiidus]|jgi:DNA-binding NarL/FixJ family response regulator|uniref:DNA-binding response regulator, NarL/FixJ family, contains REC and HTH domains n=1 Tax=Alicyclobacillus macrosporangiidus TaxID=392015 RepID=A0A1I7F4D6_9BACL|nr:response regulator transcription factor [Alicyclobacillus macrosporangiidus]SFU31029.1 DNA-binding response regulator, NarL/FixJ family, contains REC and HTH domains [Alicyclobacillus macrosporangiidus]